MYNDQMLARLVRIADRVPAHESCLLESSKAANLLAMYLSIDMTHKFHILAVEASMSTACQMSQNTKSTEVLENRYK